MQESQQNQAFKNSPTSSFTSPAISQSSNQQSYLHLPSPKDSTFSKPHESETFKVGKFTTFIEKLSEYLFR